MKKKNGRPKKRFEPFTNISVRLPSNLTDWIDGFSNTTGVVNTVLDWWFSDDKKTIVLKGGNRGIMKKTVGATIPARYKQALLKISEKSGLSISKVVELIIRQFVDQNKELPTITV